jgi:hypothetical protein
MNIFAACSSQAATCILAIGEQVFDVDERTAAFVVVGGGRNHRPSWIAWSFVDFEHKTGLSEFSIRHGLSEAEKLGIVLTKPDTDHPGRRCYSINLAGLNRLQPRAKRKCRQPKRRATSSVPVPEAEISVGRASVRSTAEDQGPKRISYESQAKDYHRLSSEHFENTNSLPELELTGKIIYGLCSLCQIYGLGDEVVKRTAQSKPSRAGPLPPLASEYNSKEKITLDQDPKFAIFWKLFEAAGKALNFQDKMAAFSEWCRYDSMTHDAILRWVVAQLKSVWRTERYSQMPTTALKSQGWTREAKPRVIPNPQGRKSDFERRQQEADADARRRLMQEGLWKD